MPISRLIGQLIELIKTKLAIISYYWNLYVMIFIIIKIKLLQLYFAMSLCALLYIILIIEINLSTRG